MKDADYAPARIFTAERVLAGGLVSAWIVTAFLIGGLPLAVRAFLLFMIPITFVCLPDLISRIAGIATRESLQPHSNPPPALLRFTGWFVILGVPIAWLVFSRI